MKYFTICHLSLNLFCVVLIQKVYATNKNIENYASFYELRNEVIIENMQKIQRNAYSRSLQLYVIMHLSIQFYMQLYVLILTICSGENVILDIMI